MKIAHHKTPHTFPFGACQSPTPLQYMNLDEWRCLPLVLEQSGATALYVTYGTSWFWPALIGLDLMSYPVMAHFALSTGYKWPGGRYFAPRVWIELSTIPEQSSDEGVECLWKADGDTYTVYDRLANGTTDPKIHTAGFWAAFFTQALLAKRNAAQTALDSATLEAKRMNLILASIPTT